LDAETLTQVLRPLQDFFPAASHPDLLVGLEDPDDAAVLKISPGRAVIFTADFFTPIVDTAYEYGAIAAANAISDIYAMGGSPALALNLFACPEQLPIATAQEILRGGAEKVREAGAVLAGGHSIRNRELKFGMAVLGFVDPDSILRKNGARVGDHLFLTKPLGSGVITTAIQRESADPRHVREAVQWMMTLNNAHLPRMKASAVIGATDISGFGLIGHASEMAERSSVSLRIKFSALPFLQGAGSYSRMGMISDGTRKNKEYFESRLRVSGSLPPEDLILLFDAQTSGGLLFCVPDERADQFRQSVNPDVGAIWEIGSVTEGKGIVVEGY